MLLSKLLKLIILISILIIPAVFADIYVGYLFNVYSTSLIILLIPIILVEVIIAYFFFKRYNIEFKIWSLFLIFFLANIVSAVVGGFTSSLFYISPRIITPIWHLLLIPAYVFSAFVEMPFIYFFIRKRAELPLKLVNFFSYLLIFIFMLF